MFPRSYFPLGYFAPAYWSGGGVSSLPTATSSLESIVAGVLLGGVTALGGRVWTREAREVSQGVGPTLPYAVVLGLSSVPAYHSRSRRHDDDQVQVAIFAETAAQAYQLGTAADAVLSFAGLSSLGVGNLRMRSRRGLPSRGRDGAGRLAYQDVLTYQGSVERITPNK